MGRRHRCCGALAAAMAVGDGFAVLNRGRRLGTRRRSRITAEKLKDLMAGGQEMVAPEEATEGRREAP